MGRLIPAGTGLERYRNIQLLTEMPPPPPPEEIVPPAELSAEEAAALDFLRRVPHPCGLCKGGAFEFPGHDLKVPPLRIVPRLQLPFDRYTNIYIIE